MPKELGSGGVVREQPGDQRYTGDTNQTLSVNDRISMRLASRVAKHLRDR
jgi:hypothetical protein